MHKEQARRKFPLFMDLGTWRILTVGGGPIARRRVQTLLEFQPGQLVVVAKQVDAAFEKWKSLPNVSVYERAYREEDLENCQMVLAATDDKELNKRIGRVCRNRGILVNVASDHRLCSFYFPATVEEDGILIAIASTNASEHSHKRVKELRERIERALAGDAG